MTADFQVLDLTVNKWLKNLMTEKFNNWFATNLQQELDSDKALDDQIQALHNETPPRWLDD